MMKCGTCKFYKEVQGRDGGGLCARYAPKPRAAFHNDVDAVGVVADKFCLDVVTFWPAVNHMWSCGEYQEYEP